MIQQSPPREREIRHLHGLLTCPRCGHLLAACDHDLGIAWRCGPCGGQSLNYSQFRRMVPEEGANDIWGTARDHPRIPALKTRCPECLSAMSAVLVPLGGEAVELHLCAPCQRLWLDRREPAQRSEPAALAPPAAVARPRLFQKPWGRQPVSRETKARCEMGLAEVERGYDEGMNRARIRRTIILYVLGILLTLFERWLRR